LASRAVLIFNGAFVKALDACPMGGNRDA